MEALTGGDFMDSDDPFALFERWMAEARSSEPRDPDAIALATVDDHGTPDVRMVLLKGFDRNGFVFYTNAESAKGRELAARAEAAFVLYWKSLNRQIRVRGAVSHASSEEADAYFASRHPRSRLGAWASEQSRPLESREALENRVEEFEAKFADGDIPRPPHWQGYRIKPFAIEFWQDRPSRLHDRVVFTRRSDDAPWARQRLNP